MTSPQAAVALAEQVLRVLHRHSVDAVVIGGFALALHHYQRTTEDLDLGVNASRTTLRLVRDELAQQGYEVVLREADGDDPLEGTIDVVDASGALVQIVNFDNHPANGFPKVISDALAALGPSTGELRVAPLPQLVAMKLYAGGSKSRQDIIELVRANPEADWGTIRAICEGYGLRTLGLF